MVTSVVWSMHIAHQSQESIFPGSEWTSRPSTSSISRGARSAGRRVHFLLCCGDHLHTNRLAYIPQISRNVSNSGSRYPIHSSPLRSSGGHLQCDLAHS